jgi:hypothetical protein
MAVRHGRVFIVESPNPLDLLKGRSERLSLEQVCRLVGHDPATFFIRDISELKQTFGYISSIESNSDRDKTPLYIHISTHGNDSGIAVGPDTVSWADLAKIVQEMYKQLCYYLGPVILILSACGANKQKMTDQLTKDVAAASKPYVPPEYVFVSSEDIVHWSDAVVAWTIFYRDAIKMDFTDKTTVQDLLNRLHKSGFGDLSYYRWDGPSKRYKRFQPKD